MISKVTWSRAVRVFLVLIVLVIPIVNVVWIPAYHEAHLLTVRGTVTEAEPVAYIRSEQFRANGNTLKLVLRLWANQQIDATIEIARIVGYYAQPGRQGETGEVRVFGMYPEKFMNRTQWDFHREYATARYVSLERVPANLLGKVLLGLEIEIFLEAPNYSSNPTFLVYWEITVYDVY